MCTNCTGQPGKPFSKYHWASNCRSPAANLELAAVSCQSGTGNCQLELADSGSRLSADSCQLQVWQLVTCNLSPVLFAEGCSGLPAVQFLHMFALWLLANGACVI